MNYKIVGGITLSMLEEEVNKEIEKGYIPIVGVCNHNNAVGCVFQGMARKVKNVKHLKEDARLGEKN